MWSSIQALTLRPNWVLNEKRAFRECYLSTRDLGFELNQSDPSGSLVIRVSYTRLVEIKYFEFSLSKARFRSEIIKQDSEAFQNKDSQFKSAYRTGEKTKSETRKLIKNWFFKKASGKE